MLEILARPEEVVRLVSLFLMALSTASLSMFLQKCMEPEMIFRRWYLLLVLKYIKWRKKKQRWKRSLLKPIGLCVYCYSTWVFIVLYLLIVSQKTGFLLYFIGLFIGMGFNYIWIKVLEKLETNK